MKILWVKTDYLHPTDRGGQIRTLEMLRRLHAWHEVDYLTLGYPAHPDGPSRAHEYCRRHFTVAHRVIEKNSPAFWGQLAQGAFGSLPLAVSRWQSAEMKKRASVLMAANDYDAVVCDFLVPAASLPDWSQLVLFQHNVEALIWERHAALGRTPLHRWYLRGQARKMESFEGAVCRAVRRVIAVSREDAQLMAAKYGRQDVAWVPTGVDVDFFAPPTLVPPVADLIFLGSMDWLPNIDGAAWLEREILPRIWSQRPQTTLALVGRRPVASIQAMAQDKRIRVSGTVEDVRPWLHGASVSVVPLRIGGGTRLKIYESMAAGVAVVSTTIGAEGLDIAHEENILLADDGESFAQACLRLLEGQEQRQRLAAQALSGVRRKHGWEAVTRQFEQLLKPA